MTRRASSLAVEGGAERRHRALAWHIVRRLQEHAEKRGVGVEQLAADIITRAVADNLVDAVSDDRSTRGENA